MSIHELSLTIRLAGAGDEPALRRLAQLESAPVPAGPALLAEVDGEVVAAYALEGGERLGDPFRRTAELLDLLEARAARMFPPPEPTSFSGRLLRRAMPRPRAV